MRPMRAPAVMPALTLALACALVAVPAAADPVQKGPYLQHLSSTSVDLKLELRAPGPVTVTVSRDAPDAGAPLTFSSPVAPFHTVHVAGLSPATRYRYSVHVGTHPASGGTTRDSVHEVPQASHDATFVTAPADTSHEPFTFLAYGDNRTDGPAHERVVQAIAKESYDFLVNTGDFVNQGSDEDAWQSFFDIEEPILKDHCLFACIGNHELHNDKAAVHFERYLAPVEPTAIDPAPPIYGSFRWGRARFFLLNAFDEWQEGRERVWLEAMLNRADKEEGVDLRIAVLHHGPYSAGPHGDNKAFLAAHIDELLTAHHVDLVLAGHDHIYERGEAHGLKYVITGGGGAPLYRELTPRPSTRKVEAAYNYVMTTVTDGQVSITAKRPDGSLIETCAFVRVGSWLCDPPPPQPAAEHAPVTTTTTTPPPAMRCSHVPGEPSAPGLATASFVLLGLALSLARRRGVAS